MKLVLGGEAQYASVLKTCTGNYILQEIKFHGKYYWIHSLRKAALWWNCNSNCWEIGDYSDRDSSNARIRGPMNNLNHPHKITSGWCYWKESMENERESKDMIATNNCWINATSSDLRFEHIAFAKGKQFVI